MQQIRFNGRALFLDKPAILRALLVAVAVIPAGYAQTQQPLSSFLFGRNGFRLGSASVSGGYYSTGQNLAQQGFGNQSIVSATGSMGWNRVGAMSHIGISYSPNYMSAVSDARYDSWNHTLAFSASRQLSKKWNLGSGFGTTYSSMDQLLFAASTFSTAASLVVTADDFADAILRNPFTNQQLASMLSSSTIADSPSRTLLFGNRVLSSSGNLSVSYAHSTRTTLTVSMGASRTQTISSGDSSQNTRLGTRGLNSSTSGNVVVTLSHSLTPRTQFGVSTQFDRAFSDIQHGHRTSTSLFIGRKMGMHWFAQAHAGIGSIISTRSISNLPTGAQYRAGGSLGFITRSHTILGSVTRDFGDQFGIGASSTLQVIGAWRWSSPRRSWAVFANVSDEQFQRSTGNLRSWQAGIGMTRMLGRHLASSIEFTRLMPDAQASRFELAPANAVRASLTWLPAGSERRK